MLTLIAITAVTVIAIIAFALGMACEQMRAQMQVSRHIQKMMRDGELPKDYLDPRGGMMP